MIKIKGDGSLAYVANLQILRIRYFYQKQLPQQLGSSDEMQLLYLIACASSWVSPVPASLNREFTLKIVGNS
jgi:hypothetical protein